MGVPSGPGSEIDNQWESFQHDMLESIRSGASRHAYTAQISTEFMAIDITHRLHHDGIMAECQRTPTGWTICVPLAQLHTMTISHSIHKYPEVYRLLPFLFTQAGIDYRVTPTNTVIPKFTGPRSVSGFNPIETMLLIPFLNSAGFKATTNNGTITICC